MTKLILIALAMVATSCAHQPTNTEATSAPKFQSGYAPVNGIKMYYEVHGVARDGVTPLVLIHGGGSTIESNYHDMIPLLTKSRQIIAIEEEGHGHTVAVGRPFTFENSADDVAALLGYLKVPRADILGFSNGGTIAMRIAVRHPEKVNHLIVASGLTRRDGMMAGFWDGMNHATIDSMPQELKDADRKINPDPRHQQQLFERDSNRMKTFKDWADKDLRSIQSPTLFIVGDRDVITVDHAKWMASLVKNSRLLVLPATHGSYLEEHPMAPGWSSSPEVTNSIVISFLDQKI